MLDTATVRQLRGHQSRRVVVDRIEADQVPADQLSVVLALLYVGDRIGEAVEQVARESRGDG